MPILAVCGFFVLIAAPFAGFVVGDKPDAPPPPPPMTDIHIDATEAQATKDAQ